ncbi:MAG: hypothetical protein ABI637_05870, partial [Gemmatimonadota bacterium]
MHELKRITAAGIPTALQKAERYRLLNEPSAAESICLDVLVVEPDNQQALIQLALARADQFQGDLAGGVDRAREPLSRVRDDYRRTYYLGIIAERRGKAQLRSHAPGGHAIAWDWLRRAMDLYEQAEAIRPDGNDESLLRWNTCARIMER